jgi:hypothetical protein
VCTEEAVQRVKCEKTAEQAVLKVEVKTEVEEDRDQLEHEVRVSFFFILLCFVRKHCVHHDDFSKSKSNQITLYYVKLRNYRHGKTWRYKNEEILHTPTHSVCDKHKYLQYIQVSKEHICRSGLYFN